MKVKVIKEAYYNLEYLKVGRIIDYKEKKLPSWATLIDGVETKSNKKPEKKEEKKVETPVEPQEKKEEKPEVKELKQKEAPKENAPVAPETEKSEVELQEELDALLDESVSKGIILEDAEKKTIEEQIAELRSSLKTHKETNKNSCTTGNEVAKMKK